MDGKWGWSGCLTRQITTGLGEGVPSRPSQRAISRDVSCWRGAACRSSCDLALSVSCQMSDEEAVHCSSVLKPNSRWAVSRPSGLPPGSPRHRPANRPATPACGQDRRAASRPPAPLGTPLPPRAMCHRRFRQVSRQNALKPQRLPPHGWGGATISGGLARELTEPTECV